MAVSRVDDNTIWFINDSGNDAELIAIVPGSKVSYRIDVRGGANRDWEDLAAFSLDGEAWLAIGDIGDNRARWEHISVYFLPEPRHPYAPTAEVQATLHLEYPDGPRDAESMAIDADNRMLYVLSKRESRPRLYRAPLPELRSASEHRLTLEYLGTVNSIPAPTADEIKAGKYGKYRAQPTSMTLVPDGGAIALLTYGGAYLATLDEEGDWLEALNERLCPLETPKLKQAETIAADAHGRIFLSSEGKRAPLYRLEGRCTASLSPAAADR